MEGFQNGRSHNTVRPVKNTSETLVKSPACAETAPLQSPTDDWRYDKISLLGVDMDLAIDAKDSAGPRRKDMGVNRGGLATKGRYESLEGEEQELGWGIVRLYRDADETPGLSDPVSKSKTLKGGRLSKDKPDGQEIQFKDEDCTTLCILAVPSYLTPADFLGFVGEKTRDDVSHFRMIRTEMINRYMVLMKFRSGKKARVWRQEWNGKAFDGMEVSVYPPNPSDVAS